MVVEVVKLSKLVGHRIRQIRKKLELTQEELGERAKLQSSYIGGVERGERNISLDTLEKIIVAFNMDLSEFFMFEDLDIDTDLEKDELIEVFKAELLNQDVKVIKKIFTIYKQIYDIE